MSSLRALVYGKEYTLACDDGQERHLQQLVAQVQERTERLGGHLGHIPENLMLLYSALMIADELHESRSEIAKLKQHIQQIGAGIHTGASSAELEATMAHTLQDIATRIESIAAKLA